MTRLGTRRLRLGWLVAAAFLAAGLSLVAGLVLVLAQAATPGPAAVAIAVLAEEDGRSLIRHARGETWIPAAPQRIVALDPALVDAVLALDTTPVGIAAYGNQPYAWLVEELAGVPIVGDPAAPDLEAVASLTPDLILLSEDQVAFLSPQTLQVIAPIVVLTAPQADVARTLLDVGLLIGKEEQAAVRLALYDERLARAREQVAAAVGTQPVAVLSLYRGQPRLYGVTSPPGALYRDLGLTPAPLVPLAPVDDQWWVPLSTERLPELGAEHLFLMAAEEGLLEELSNTGLWETVPAVRDGHVYQISNEQLSAWWGNVLGREAAIAGAVVALTGAP
ncbi:MAG: ABC transporter substrate-binding protein [Thermomicrobiales bacterium]|nr:ABC transporter substrate-binding protein [Thermomicrobiales bacterium]